MASVSERIQAVEQAETENFLELVKIAKLDPSKSFQYANLRGVDFSNCDLGGFNFTGSALSGANFSGCKISDALFDNVQLQLPELSRADDYDLLIKNSVNRFLSQDEIRTKNKLKSHFESAIFQSSPEAQIPRNLPEKPLGRTILVSIGKAASSAAKAFETHWDGPLDGLVLTPYGIGEPSDRFAVIEAGFPVPDGNALSAAGKIQNLISNLTKDDLVVLLLSPGATALTAAPIGDITLSELSDLNRRLLSVGASLSDMNLVRSYLTAHGCGRLANEAYPAQLVTLVIHDGPADSIAQVGGSQTRAVNVTSDEVAEILHRHRIDTPISVDAVLKSPDLAPPSPDAPCFQRTTTKIVTSWDLMLKYFADSEVLEGTEIVNLGALEGQAQNMAQEFANRCRAVIAERHQHPVMLVSGGEATVDYNGGGIGQGGRNAEFLLSLAIALDGQAGVSAIAVDTDGHDGTMDAAGAFISPTTLARARASNIDPQTFLRQHHSFYFFQQLDDLIVTGPTGTGMSDLRAILIEPVS
ncbi:DUF4147 domain-containing protein [Stappia sp. ES.058]|uniref:DUF4147 domain-containing protein n=1 Tax=Stappia sp. ES.058 TaxID=1881061 RepID=UPI00087BAA61|nr:DUF4147 domain-containing protein [Stappia sp. ES.058]SDU42552.1 glycerate 2-kinase [Stappia sp. ES.058]